MTIEQFISRFRRLIDQHIGNVCPNCGPLDNDEREDWIANDEYLYSWALAEGVDV